MKQLKNEFYNNKQRKLSKIPFNFMGILKINKNGSACFVTNHSCTAFSNVRLWFVLTLRTFFGSARNYLRFC